MIKYINLRALKVQQYTNNNKLFLINLCTDNLFENFHVREQVYFCYCALSDTDYLPRSSPYISPNNFLKCFLKIYHFYLNLIPNF